METLVAHVRSTHIFLNNFKIPSFYFKEQSEQKNPKENLFTFLFTRRSLKWANICLTCSKEKNYLFLVSLTELMMTEWKSMVHILPSSQSSIAALKNVLPDGKLTPLSPPPPPTSSGAPTDHPYTLYL